MIRRWLLIVLVLAGFSGTGSSVWAAVETGGTISVDTTWTNSDTIVVTSMVIVSDGCRLTVQTGTVIQFNPIVSFNIIGELMAEGTAAERIVFTTRSDTTGGEPFVGEWNGLTFMDYSRGFLRYCDFRYGLSNVYVVNADVVIYRSRIYSCQNGIEIYGMSIFAPHFNISNCDIRDHAENGLYVHPGG